MRIGRLQQNIRIVAVTTSVAATDYTLAVQNGGANVTVTLPSAVTNPGRIIVIKRLTPSTGTITVTAVAGRVEALAGTLGATTTLAALGANGSRVTFQSDGADWQRISS